MAREDRRLTYVNFTVRNGREPTVEDVQDGYVMCACGNTLREEEFEYYTNQCEACAKRTAHEPAIEKKFEKDFETGGVRRIDTTNARYKAEKREPLDRPERMAKVIEIPAGEYDAVRTLRHCLAMAEKGEIDDVVLVCSKKGEPAKPADGDDIWMTWSDMPRWSVWWYVGWAHAFIYRRYFHGDGPDEYTDQAG